MGDREDTVFSKREENSVAPQPEANNSSTDAVRESIKLGFESVKHLTTLSAGSTVLIATFLKDIFPRPADLSGLLQWTVGLAFLAFGVSLVFAAFSFWGFSVMLRSKNDFHESVNRLRYRWYMAGPSLFFIIGLMLFALAVLTNLFKFGTAGYIFLVVIFILVFLGPAILFVRYLQPKRSWETVEPHLKNFWDFFRKPLRNQRTR